jgi:hypothetical protein
VSSPLSPIYYQHCGSCRRRRSFSLIPPVFVLGDPTSVVRMTGRATSAPMTHEQEVKVLYVGGDDRETLLKALRVSAPFNESQS